MTYRPPKMAHPKYDWLLDLLVELKAFAVLNGMGSLAKELDRTTRVAEYEIAIKEGSHPSATRNFSRRQ